MSNIIDHLKKGEWCATLAHRLLGRGDDRPLCLMAVKEGKSPNREVGKVGPRGAERWPLIAEVREAPDESVLVTFELDFGGEATLVLARYDTVSVLVYAGKVA